MKKIIFGILASMLLTTLVYAGKGKKSKKKVAKTETCTTKCEKKCTPGCVGLPCCK